MSSCSRVIKNCVTKIKQITLLWYAEYWQNYYKTKNFLITSIFKYKNCTVAFILVCMIIFNLFFYSKINSIVEPYFQINDRTNEFQTLLLGLGSAMIGG